MAYIEPNYRTDLVDGYVLRNATPADIQAFSAVIAYLSEDPWAKAVIYALFNSQTADGEWSDVVGAISALLLERASMR